MALLTLTACVAPQPQPRFGYDPGGFYGPALRPGAPIPIAPPPVVFGAPLPPLGAPPPAMPEPVDTTNLGPVPTADPLMRDPALDTIPAPDGGRPSDPVTDLLLTPQGQRPPTEAAAPTPQQPTIAAEPAKPFVKPPAADNPMMGFRPMRGQTRPTP